MENMRKVTSPLKLLAEIKSYDEYTYSHTANVGILSMFLAEYLGFEGSHLNDIGVAAILHDVGKATTPDDILSKPGALTFSERAVMETHPAMGAMRLMEMKGITNLAVIVAMEHHIKFDGSGYPRIKGRWKTNIVSQMITVGDAFDAMRTNRPYRKPLPQDRIAQILINESGSTFNSYLVKRFLNLIEK
jgi:putative nucleotidyltransferase with HDIG domain